MRLCSLANSNILWGVFANFSQYRGLRHRTMLSHSPQIYLSKGNVEVLCVIISVLNYKCWSALRSRQRTASPGMPTAPAARFECLVAEILYRYPGLFWTIYVGGLRLRTRLTRDPHDHCTFQYFICQKILLSFHHQTVKTLTFSYTIFTGGV